MVAVDRWVIRHTIAEIANLHERKRKVNLFVNVAAETLQEERLLIWICDYLREYEVRGNWLTIQIAEEHAMRHPDAFSRLRDGLRKVKCRIALNRCGLGPDAQGVFENALADFARLAPELGAELATDERRQAQVRRLVEAAREAGTRSIVPHVADPYSLAQLWRMGVDYVQGNFLQVPAPSIDAGN
jgi:EAL domain-containing protein (putative c-di-GMP-specific phosphodiesterase class I)